jgi:hypothetical protein
MRAGICMTPLKATIFDTIKAAGDIGITSRELIAQAFEGRRAVDMWTVKAHVWQINELLEETDFIIRSDRRRWMLERRRARVAS